MKILRVKKTNLFDVFVGDGWNNWSRVIHTNNNIHIVTGNKLKPYQLHSILKHIPS